MGVNFFISCIHTPTHSFENSCVASTHSRQAAEVESYTLNPNGSLSLFVLLSSCQESRTLQGHTLSVTLHPSRSNAQHKVLEVMKAPLSQFPALPQGFLCLPAPHHLWSMLLPCEPRPHLASGDCFLNCRTVNQEEHLVSQDRTRCAQRSYSWGRVFLKASETEQ